jgi:Fur family iron response transcriptional regulator
MPADWLRFGLALPMVEATSQMRRPMLRPQSTTSSRDAKAAVKSAAPGAALQGCPVHDLRAKLRKAGLRPTRQRVALGWLLFAKGDRHITAEKLYDEATGARVPISLATVYNTLHQFTEAGLLREIAVDGSKTYFDTNLSNHHHFLIEDTNLLVDIPGAQISVGPLPTAPEGMEIARVDVIVRLRSAAK